MFAWLFADRGVKKTAALIHQMCHMGRHANATFGPAGAQSSFKNHPFLTRHVAPSRNGDPHTFWFPAQLEPFEFLVYDDKDVIQIMGGGDYAGLTLTTTERGTYIVSVRQTLLGAAGRKAKALAHELTEHYGATDTTEWS